MAPTQSGPTSSTTFADLASAAGSQGGPGPGEGGPAVGGAGSFPASFDLANINLGNLGVVAPESNLAGVGVRGGPTGTVSLTTGNKTIDTALGIAGKAFGMPTSINLLGQAASLFGGPVLSALAAFTGPVGALLTAMQLTHAISSQFDSTLAGQINAVLHDETLTPQQQAQMLAELNAQGPQQGGVQAIGQLPFDNPVTNVNASTQAGPASGAGQNLSLAESLSLTPTFAQLANALGFGRTDVTGGAPTGPPTGQAEADAATAAATAGTGVSSGGAAGEGAPAGSGGAPGGSGDSPAM
jgi:hypothetical protein